MPMENACQKLRSNSWRGGWLSYVRWPNLMEQVFAILFMVVTITTVIVVFAPTLENAILKRLRLSKWAGMPDDSLLVFVLIFPIWLPFWISIRYWRLVEWIVTEPGDDEVQPTSKAAILVFLGAGVIYVMFFLGPLYVLLWRIFFGEWP